MIDFGRLGKVSICFDFCGSVWNGLVIFGLIWKDSERFGKVWRSLVKFG